MRAKIAAFLAGILAVASVAAFAQTSGGGFPSRPRFQAVGVGVVAPPIASGRVSIAAPTGIGPSLLVAGGGSGGTNANIVTSSTGIAAVVAMNATGNTADNRVWDVGPIGPLFQIRAVNDANSVSTAAIEIARTGSTSGQVRLSEPNYGAAGALRNAATYESGSFTGTPTGLTTTPAFNVRWARAGNNVALCIDQNGATSNATTFELSVPSMPASIRPAAVQQSVFGFGQNNGAFTFVGLQVPTSGNLVFVHPSGSASWTASGAKQAGGCISYTLN